MEGRRDGIDIKMEVVESMPKQSCIAIDILNSKYPDNKNYAITLKF